ncbi:cytochrome c [Thalassovita sp.]|uniref:c-type cytochrome n=1 Tax=Thalassovita sp. TaxID=1979401 RepID=UPI0029DE79E5|nr:cytochrome c [Thalassovita sp.]
MKKYVLVTAILASFLGIQSVAAETAGQREYMVACAGCHGESGKGDGPLAGLLKIETPDLTRLAARNGGKFPFEYTIFMIDRRNLLPIHGEDMPVWGDRFQVDTASERGETAEMVARGRLLSLTYYLESIQE